MRQTLFEIEQSIFLNKNDNFKDDHVFIAGLARSGTTTLLNSLYLSNQFASLTYDDMPFILSPNLWSKINYKKNTHKKLQERMHGDSIKISSNSPEAFEEVFWKTFGHDFESCEDLYINFISLILKKSEKNRYLSKNNQNIRRLNLINKTFPFSKILIPFRDPLQHAFSLYSQHMKFIKNQTSDIFLRDYMKWIGHSEFGLDYKAIHTSNLKFPNEGELNHWLEQWFLCYESVLESSRKYKNFYLIEYESLCKDQRVWTNLKDLLKIDKDFEFLFKESQKVITEDFDSALANKCYDLYNSLHVKSFPYCK